MSLTIEILLSIFFVFFKCVSLRAESAPTGKTGKFYHFVQPVQAPTFLRDKDGNLKRSGETVYFKSGDFFKTNTTGSDGTLWINISSAKNNELVAIPPTSLKTGTSWLGEKDFIKESDWLNGKFNYRIREQNVQPLVNGKTTKLGKFAGTLGREDAIVYLDSDARNRLALRPDVKAENLVCSGEVSKNCNGPTTEDPLRIVDSTVAYVLDRKTGDYAPRLFYKVQSTYCPNGTVDACNVPLKKDQIGWVEARKVSMTRRPAISSSPIIRGRRQYNEAACPDASNRQVKDLVQGIAATEEAFESDVLNKIGSCLGIEYVTHARKIRDDLIQKSVSSNGGSWSAELSAEQKERYKTLGDKTFPNDVAPFDKYVGNYWKLQPSQKISGNDLTNDQLYAIDSLARSLYGEMRSCASESPAYYKAVGRAIINRSAILKAKGPTLPFVKNAAAPVKDKPIDKIIPFAVSSDKQISSWNPADPNLKDNLCPVSNTTNPEQMAAWKSAVKVAWEAVAYRKQFLEETNGITHTHYYSPEALPSGKTEPDWAVGKQKDVNFKVGDSWFGNSGCLILVVDSNNKKIDQIRKKNPNGFSFRSEIKDFIFQ